ncbi:cytohesin-interacting protein [Aplochiton taeniatus]
MNFNMLQRQASQDSYIVEDSLKKRGRLWYRRSLKESNDKHHQSAGTLPRGWKQTKQRTNSLVDYSDPQRTTVVLEKHDNETFGFEIQTYGLQLRNNTALELCTFVCTVQEDSAAENAGLTAGDVIVTINGVSIEGSSHQHIVDLIRESTNSLKMETVCGSVVKRIELDKKMSLLKQTLREKWVELQALTLQEKRLMRGNLKDTGSNPSVDSLMSLVSPMSRQGGRRFSSDSSCRSLMADESDTASVFGDLSSPSLCSAASTPDNGCFFSSDMQNLEDSNRSLHGDQLTHNRNTSLVGSNGSFSPSWEETRTSNLFGTLPRKARRASVRKHILKFIPGLNRSVEEEADTRAVNEH